MTSLRTETRYIRPFAGISLLEDSLENVHLVHNGQPIEESSVLVPESDLLADSFGLSVEISKAPIRLGLSSLDLTEHDILVYIMAIGRTLKSSMCLYSQPLSEFQDSFLLELDRTAHPQVFMDRGGFNLRCCLLLGSDHDKKSLRPHRAGTWLAARDFRVGLERDGISGFNPSRLTADTKKQLNLPGGTMTYLELRSSVLDTDDLNSAIAFYVDEAVMDSLASDQQSTVGQALQVELVIQFLMDLLAEIVKELQDDNKNDLETEIFADDSEISTFVKNAAEQTGLPIAEFFKLFRVNPSEVRARFQDAFSAKKLSIQSLRSA